MGNRKSTQNSTCTTSSCKCLCSEVYCVVRWGFTASFIIEPFFFEETCALGLFTITITGQRYECLLRNHIITALQQRGYVDQISFMQDGAPPHIANLVKQLLNWHFRNAKIISRHFSKPGRSDHLILNPCDFWLWGYRKDVFSTPFAHLAKLKVHIEQYILNETPETLRSIVEHTVSRFQLLAENNG